MDKNCSGSESKLRDSPRPGLGNAESAALRTPWLPLRRAKQCRPGSLRQPLPKVRQSHESPGIGVAPGFARHPGNTASPGIIAPRFVYPLGRLPCRTVCRLVRLPTSVPTVVVSSLTPVRSTSQAPCRLCLLLIGNAPAPTNPLLCCLGGKNEVVAVRHDGRHVYRRNVE